MFTKVRLIMGISCPTQSSQVDSFVMAAPVTGVTYINHASEASGKLSHSLVSVLQLRAYKAWQLRKE